LTIICFLSEFRHKQLSVVCADAPPPGSYLQVLQQENALSLVLATLEPLDTRHMLLPVSFISRLITTAQEAFAVQYVQVCLTGAWFGWLLQLSGPFFLLYWPFCCLCWLVA
jgi:hypothetical protein